MSSVSTALCRLMLSLRNPTNVARPRSVHVQLGIATLSTNLRGRSGLRAKQRGMTLIELVITIVIIGIAAAAMFSAMAAITGRSADPMLRQQSLALAEAYLESISTRVYADLPGAAQSAQAAQDINGNAILSGYLVAVDINAGVVLDGVPATRIRVTVTDPIGQTLQLDGYRTNY